jgi:LysR family transcriptional regulator, cyn operon transcriptional activator
MDRNFVFPRSIRYLLAVADHRSFTRAAEVLFVSQPTLSQQIKQLEEALGVQLLDRSARAVRLTDAGEVYARYARRALVELDAGKRALHQLEDLSRGSLQVGMTPITDYLVTPLLENFSRHFPGVALSAIEMSQSDIEVAVAEDRIDLGVAFTNTLLSSNARSSDIETHILFIEALHLAVGKVHPCAQQQTPISGQVLEQTPLVLLSTKFALRRHVDLYCIEHGFAPQIAMETNSLSVIVEMVRLGRLATVLPKAIACAQWGLNPIMLLPELPHHAITLICRRGAYKSPACLAFAELASEWSARRCEAAPMERLDPCPLAETCETSRRGAYESAMTAPEELPAAALAARNAPIAAAVSPGNSS